MEAQRMPVSAEERRWGALAHLAGLAIVLLPPFGGLLATWVVWYFKGGSSPYIEEQAREAVNFQLVVLLAVLLGFGLLYVLIGVFILIGVVVADLGCMIRGAFKARHGVIHYYPYSLRLIKKPR